MLDTEVRLLFRDLRTDSGGVALLRILVIGVFVFGTSALAGPDAGAATLAVLLLWTIARLLVWSARRRNEAELREFELVAAGQLEVKPAMLARIWK